MNFDEIELKRVIIHKIIGKTKEAPAYSEPSVNLHNLDAETKKTLLIRIYDAIGKSKRFFETKLDNTEENSFWDYTKGLRALTKEDFIEKSSLVSELAAEAHQSRNRPGGLLIVMDTIIDKMNSTIVIKAELQEALIINGDAIELIKELFLSPAKEFFKIGILIHRNSRSNNKQAYDSYVYDDNFSSQKNDLATYFYKDFLGFSTHDNDKLKTNNFLKDFLNFVDKNIAGDFESRKLIKNRIKADYRQSSSEIIDPTSYQEFFNFNIELDRLYQNTILKKFPRSFSKDLSLVDSSLQKSSLQITSQLKISGPSDLVDSIEVLNPEDEGRMGILRTEIESGNVLKLVVLKSDSIRPSFK